MSADTLIVDGQAYSWRRLCELRRAQIEAQNRARLRQLPAPTRCVEISRRQTVYKVASYTIDFVGTNLLEPLANRLGPETRR